MKLLKPLFISLAFIALALAPFTGQNRAQERIALTTPAFVDAGVTNIKVVFLQCDWDNANVIIGIRATDINAVPLPTRPRFDINYTGATASNMMRLLNTNNFSVNSMHKKILQKLTADGHISSGTITGPAE